MIINVEGLTKEFKVVKKEKGLTGAVKGLFFPQKSIVKAVDDISFNIKAGEIVGYVGPNGAGKSTTVKLLSGILHPTSGKIKIFGMNPNTNRKEIVNQLGVVFGQKSQLNWDLRLGESFELLRRIFRVETDSYKKNIELFNDILKINEFVNIPVRQLSLGQRMRGDLVAAMLHSPKILYLDEPTIGLDFDGKEAIRQFILEINKKNNITVILTTHDLEDVKKLCSRLMIIDHGRVIRDGALDSLMQQLAPYRTLIVELKDNTKNITHPMVHEIKHDGYRIWLRFDGTKISASSLISDLSRDYQIRDLSVREPEIEDVIKKVLKR